MPGVDPLARNNVLVTGNPDGRTMVFAHAFGGTRESWRFVAPAFEDEFRVVVFDLMGAGGSDLSAYDRVKYDSLHGYADDLVEILDALGARDTVFVGHSVSAMIGILAANDRPELFSRLVLVGPSPRYVDTDGYRGGFTRDAIDGLLEALDANYASFSHVLASALTGSPATTEMGDDLAATIRGNDPAIAAQFARVTFLSDNRRDLADVTVPSLVLQSAEDGIAGPEVGRYVHEHIAGSRFEIMSSRTHVPNLSDPDELTTRIRTFVSSPA